MTSHHSHRRDSRGRESSVLETRFLKLAFIGICCLTLWEVLVHLFGPPLPSVIPYDQVAPVAIQLLMIFGPPILVVGYFLYALLEADR